MKDLEKIKSEDLGCQVADANPGNFAIEQEVAQLVGATVPAPTEPSADDARELGAQLLVFLRRALLPIRSVLRTALAAIYAHLDSRCTDYTPAAYAPYSAARRAYDPMGTPPTPRTLPNLLTAITAFDSRKISNGSAPSDGIPDGEELARIFGQKIATEIKDGSTPGWELEGSIDNVLGLQSVKKMTLNCKDGLDSVNRRTIRNLNELEELELAYVEEIGSSSGNTIYHNLKLKRLDMRGTKRVYGYAIGACQALRYIRWGTLTTYNCNFNEQTLPDLIHLEFGADTACDINLSKWDATNALDASRTDLIEQGSTAENNLQQFLQNFKNHIALRLTSNGSGLTLTLSQAVRDAIHAAEATYGIEAIIVTQKGWTLSPAPTA